MLRKLIAVVALSLLLLPAVALAYEPGDLGQEEEEWILYDGVIEPAESGDIARQAEAEGPAGEGALVEGSEHGVNR